MDVSKLKPMDRAARMNSILTPSLSRKFEGDWVRLWNDTVVNNPHKDPMVDPLVVFRQKMDRVIQHYCEDAYEVLTLEEAEKKYSRRLHWHTLFNCGACILLLASFFGYIQYVHGGG